MLKCYQVNKGTFMACFSCESIKFSHQLCIEVIVFFLWKSEDHNTVACSLLTQANEPSNSSWALGRKLGAYEVLRKLFPF